jgi:hypothetical protein
MENVKGLLSSSAKGIEIFEKMLKDSSGSTRLDRKSVFVKC